MSCSRPSLPPSVQKILHGCTKPASHVDDALFKDVVLHGFRRMGMARSASSTSSTRRYTH
uniref:Uncharacterized protein n=1 Tax=Triticum urartu TaxID=4572 RepID=A0A8R7ULC2_TRIUA